jgi:superfamily I DNA/RNA helicase
VPEILTTASQADAIQVAVEHVLAWTGEEAASIRPSICVMTHSRNQRDQVAQALKAHGITVSTIEADTGDTAANDTVRVSTMHRAKGLEFDRVVVLAQGMLDSMEHDFAQLVYVALTRAKSVAVLIK